MNAIEIFTKADYNTEKFSNRQRVIQQINSVIDRGATIKISPKGMVSRRNDGVKFNISVSMLGVTMTTYVSFVEPIYVLNVCARILQHDRVKEQIKASVSVPCDCYKCGGSGVLPEFFYTQREFALSVEERD